jgi:hypothetical protein
MIKKLAVSVFLLFLIFPLHAVSVELQGHYDTYESLYNKPYNVGISFCFSEQIKNNFTVDASLNYKYGGKYLAYCSGSANFGNFYTRAGVAMDLREFKVSPGFLLTLDYRIWKPFSIMGDLLITLSPEDISLGSVFDSKAGVVFHFINQKAKLLYNFRRELEKDYMLTYHYGVIDITGFESGFPFRMAVFIKGGAYLDTRVSGPRDVKIEAGGRFELVTKKAGVYFIAGEANVFQLSTMTSPLTFAVSAGFRFNIR